MTLPRVSGLFEAHLAVGDLERSIAFWEGVVGLPMALKVPERAAAFLWVGAPGEAMLGLWSLGSAPLAVSSHIALRARLDEVLGACGALQSAGVAPLDFFGAPTGEPSVIGWMPAVAVYFRDPDGHLGEYLAMLDEPARPDLGIVAWSQWPAASAVSLQIHEGDREDLRPLFTEAEDSAALLDQYIGEGEVVVALVDGAVVGHAQLIDTELRNMAVAPSHRDRSIGRRLVEEIARIARQRGAASISVATASADTGNLRFYQRCGFRLRAVERDAFTPSAGYAPDATIDGIPLRDRVWLDRVL